MTTAEFGLRGEGISSVTVSGHAGYGGEGEDIVCASVSSAVYMAANTITDVIRCESAEVSVSEGENAVLTISVGGCRDDRCQAVLRGLKLHLEQLAEQYPQFVTVKQGQAGE